MTTSPAWVQYVILAWPVITALASLAAAALDKTTYGHAVLSFLASLGIDLPKLLDALRRLLPGQAGTSARLRNAAKVVLPLVLVLGLVGPQVACTPAEQAEEARIEQVILSDLAAGKTLEQVETDVAALVAGQPGADVVVIVNDALAFLIDVGVIPANVLPQARAMLATTSAQRLARGR